MSPVRTRPPAVGVTDATHGGVGVVLPQHLPGVGVDGRHMSKALSDGILIPERIGGAEEWSAGCELKSFGST